MVTLRFRIRLRPVVLGASEAELAAKLRKRSKKRFAEVPKKQPEVAPGVAMAAASGGAMAARCIRAGPDDVPFGENVRGCAAASYSPLGAAGVVMIWLRTISEVTPVERVSS